MRVSLGEVVAMAVVSLVCSSSGIKTWSVVSGTQFAPDFYIVGAVFSMLIFSLLLLVFASMRAWARVH